MFSRKVEDQKVTSKHQLPERDRDGDGVMRNKKGYRKYKSIFVQS